MSFEQRKAEFERRASRLVGHRITRVRYFEILYEGQQPGWNWGAIHQLDFGLDLETESGKTFSVTWDGDFAQYGISLREGSLAIELAQGGHAVWDVSCISRWSSVLHKTITQLIVHWTWLAKGGRDGPRTYYPVDFEIAFESGDKVFLSAAGYSPDTDDLALGDDVLVIFRDDVARRYRVGPYAEE